MDDKRYTQDAFAIEAKRFLDQLLIDKGRKDEEEATVVALHGDLGAGKTTFTQILAHELGVEDYVVSPTFLILKTYKLSAPSTKWKQLVHIDAYRIEDSERLETLGWKDLIQSSDNLIVIEWPENIKNILPENTYHIYFEFINETTRSIQYTDFK